MKLRTKVLVLAAGIAGTTAIASAGWAYWSAHGTGSAAASVGTLNAPTNVTATATPGTGTVPVSWTASSTTSPAGVAPAGYFVRRFAGATPTAACGSASNALLTGATCNDASVLDGTYTYQVTAVYHSWTASSIASTSVTVVNDATPPTVSSITRATASPTNAAGVSWAVTFSEPVTGVDTGDFALAAGGSVTGASITGVSGSGSTYTVVAGTGAGDGTLGLNLVDDDSIKDLSSNKLGGAGNGNGNFTGQVFSIDKTAPSVLSITRSGANPTNAASVAWTVTFSETVNGADASDFALAATGISGASITSATGTTFTVTANTGSGDGTVGLNLVDDDTIVDLAGNKLGGTGAGNGNLTGQAYSIDKTAPTATIVKAAAQQDPTNTLPVNFTVTFNETVTGLTSAGLNLGGTATGTKSAIVTGSGTTYNVAVTGATATGTLTASVKANAATDAAGNSNGASATATVGYDITAPTVNINQASGQADPTNTGTISFTAVFSESVTGFGPSGVTVGGTAGGTKNVSVTGSGASYAVTVSGATGNGTVTATVTVGAAQDAAGNGSTASSSADNSVTLDTTAPTALLVSTLNGGATGGLPDQGDSVSLTFSEPINTASVLGGWTGAATGVVVRAADGGSGSDSLTIFNASNTTQLALGSLDLGSKTYFTGNVTFGASGTASSMTAVTTNGTTTITITFGTVSDATKTGPDSPNGRSIVTWTPSATVTDLAGNNLNASTHPATNNVKEF